MNRRTVLTTAAAACVTPALPSLAQAQKTPACAFYEFFDFLIEARNARGDFTPAEYQCLRENLDATPRAIVDN